MLSRVTAIVLVVLGAVADARADTPAPQRPASALDVPADPTCADGPCPVSDDKLTTYHPRVLTPASTRKVLQPFPRPTLAWLLTQLVPSPGLWIGEAHSFDATRYDGELPPGEIPRGILQHRGVPRLSLAWQITPLLYSFGVNRRVSPWRVLVVDPFARNSGSIELHFSPEWIPSAPETTWFYRAGVRTTLPLYRHGEHVALMLGAAYARNEGRGGVIYEGGLSLLYGTLGLVLSHSPSFPELRYGVRINLRYF